MTIQAEAHAPRIPLPSLPETKKTDPTREVQKPRKFSSPCIVRGRQRAGEPRHRLHNRARRSSKNAHQRHKSSRKASAQQERQGSNTLCHSPKTQTKAATPQQRDEHEGEEAGSVKDSCTGGPSGGSPEAHRTGESPARTKRPLYFSGAALQHSATARGLASTVTCHRGPA